MSDFEKCTTKEITKGGRVEIECVLGLWGVSAAVELDAINEAYHYFQQYKSAGEYSSIIGGKSVVEMLIEGMYKRKES